MTLRLKKNLGENHYKSWDIVGPAQALVNYALIIAEFFLRSPIS